MRKLLIALAVLLLVALGFVQFFPEQAGGGNTPRGSGAPFWLEIGGSAMREEIAPLQLEAWVQICVC